MKTEEENVLVLHDIRSVVNAGAMVRTAEALGVTKIFLSGYTPGPVDRFGRVRSDFHKAALGAETLVQFEWFESIEATVARLREYFVIALEQDARSRNIRNFDRESVSEKPWALVVGNEVDGVASEFIKRADVILEISLTGKKESLNVSAAAAIALYEMSSKLSTSNPSSSTSS